MEKITAMNDILQGLNIDGACVNYKEHRHLAFYDIKLKPGATVRRIEARTREIALAINSRTTPIVKVIPNKGVVRLQIATSEPDKSLDLCFNGTVIPPIEESLLPIMLGETDEGNQFWVDITKHPHTLIAGGTGSGKSALLRTIIANLVWLQVSGARKIELYLSDPKRVEFHTYEGMKKIIPYIAYDYESTLGMLKNLDIMMESRYDVLAKLGYTSVEECPNIFPSVVVIIDEVSDLMIQDKRSKQFEMKIVKLAQKCRAAGIYLILSTQRPSVDVLTGLIKTNFPARISCKVSSRVDSQVILDSSGAECLLGRGDAILQSPINDKTRFQVAFIETKRIIKEYNSLIAA